MTRAVRRARSAARTGTASAITPSPDQAWHILERTGSSISDADTKAGFILGAAGVASGALFSIVHGAQTPTAWTVVAAIICAALLLACALCAGMGVLPRRRRRVIPASLVYFDHVARLQSRSGEEYAAELAELLGRPERLTRELGLQIWETSRVAAAKYSWIDRALILLLSALLVLSATAVLAVVTT